MAIAAVLAVIPAKVAESKGRSFLLWWVYGWMLLIVAIPHALLLRPRPSGGKHPPEPETILTSPKPDMSTCPNCGEQIRADTPTCIFCRAPLDR
jgi:hypothetical protein